MIPSEYSCVIPVRDRREMVREAVASVLAQDIPAAEIIVVDDGSRDGTAAALAGSFPGIRLVRLEGAGPGAARNAGVAATSAKVIMFLDSDDLWLPDHAGRLLAVLDRGFAVAYGRTRTLNQVGGGEFMIPEAGEEVEGESFAALLRWCFLLPSAVALTRPAFDLAGGFDSGDLGEDWSFFLKLACRYPFGFAAGPPLTLRRLHPGSLCHIVDPTRLIATLRRLQNLSLPAACHSSRKASAAVRERFADLACWSEERADEQRWRSIQEWYLALRRGKMV